MGRLARIWSTTAWHRESTAIMKAAGCDIIRG
jgi:hypothetical protein